MSSVGRGLQICALPTILKNIRRYSTSKVVTNKNRSIWALSSLGLVVLSGGYLYYQKLDQQNKRLVKLTLDGTWRFLRSVKVGLVISLDYWWTLRGLEEGSSSYHSEIHRCHQRSADRIVEGALCNGGLYIKLGQGLGSFNHVLPGEYIKTLAVLQDMVLTRSSEELDELFMEDFGQRPEDLFIEFNRQPVAAASLAQVFHARMHSGERVAVKAQYIDLRDRFNGDVHTIKLLLKIVQKMHPKFSFAWVFEEIKDSLAEELDFINEGHNSERCYKDLQHFPYIHVPKVHWDKTTKRVLTTEWIDGCKITDTEGLKSLGLSSDDVCYKLLKAFSHQIFHTGFVHGDPHPGNIFVRKHQAGDSELVILDHGLYMRLSEKDRRALCQVWKSSVLHNIPALKEASESLGIEDYRLFALMLTGRSLETHKKQFGGKASLSQLTMSDADKVMSSVTTDLDKVVQILRNIPKEMLLVFRNINIVRSIIRTHHTPVNRFNIMAKSAIAGARTGSDVRGIGNFITKWKEIILFDISLRWWDVKIWITKKYLQFLIVFNLTSITRETVAQIT